MSVLYFYSLYLNLTKDDCCKILLCILRCAKALKQLRKSASIKMAIIEEAFKEKGQYEKVAETENGLVQETGVPQYGYGVRHVQSLLIFTSLCIAFSGRAHLGVTIVAMVDTQYAETLYNSTVHFSTVTNSTNYSNANGLNVTADTKFRDDNNSTNSIDFEDNIQELNLTAVVDEKSDSSKYVWSVFRTYKWQKSIQEMILGSFFVGYMIMMFPMGLVCQRWGGKLPLQISLISTSIISIATPWLAVWGGWKAVCLSRILTGMTQAGIYPSIHTLVAKWVPLSERGTLVTYIYTGSMIGTIIGFQVSGFLASFGWPFTFWFVGLLCFITFGMLTVFVAASPLQHNKITDEEKNFILGHICDGVEKRHATPWKQIFRSKHVWATFVAHIGSSVTFVFFFTQVPSYLHFIQNVDVKSSGLLSSLPYFANFVASIGIGSLSDYCTNRKIVTNKRARQISNTLATVGPSVCLACLSFTSNTTLAVLCLVITLAAHAGVHTGWMLNYIDLAPNYSGALMATGNTLMNVGVMTLPMMVANIVVDVTNPYQWRIVLYLISSFSIICNIVYVCFMSSDVQPWNDSGYEATEQEEKGAELK